jgi:hypothetical protein
MAAVCSWLHYVAHQEVHELVDLFSGISLSIPASPAACTLAQARARDAHAGEDREKKRPKYPPMVGGEPEDEAVVIEVRTYH